MERLRPTTPLGNGLGRIRAFRKPVVVICGWWLAVLMMADVIRIGEPIGLETHLVVAVFVATIFIAGIVFARRTHKELFSVPRWIASSRTLLSVLAVLVYVYTIYLGVVGYRLQEVYGAEFRTLVFGTGGYDSLLYGSYYIQVLAGLVLAPIVLFGVIMCAVAGVYYSRFMLIVLGLVFATAADFQSAGRFHTYYFLLATALSVLYCVKKVSRGLVAKLLISLALMLLSLFVSSARRSEVYVLSGDTIARSVEQAIDYHIYGINLLDRELSDDNALIHRETSLGRLTLLSYFDRIACMILRRAGIEAIPLVDKMAEHWQRTVWLTGAGAPREVNAFYTSLYPMYYDFGWLGVIGIPLLIMSTLVKHYEVFLRQWNITSLFVVVFASVFFMTSIFNSKITAVEFVTIWYGIGLLSPASKRSLMEGTATG